MPRRKRAYKTLNRGHVLDKVLVKFHCDVSFNLKESDEIPETML